MTYFLDFDRTIFDMDRLYPILFARPEFSDVSALISSTGAHEGARFFSKRLANGTFSFAGGELSPFLFSDVQNFLLVQPSVIITHGFENWQRAKVESAFNGLPPVPILYTELEEKGPALARVASEYRQPHIFVDDDAVQLDSVAHMMPTIQVFEMRRDGKDGYWQQGRL